MKLGGARGSKKIERRVRRIMWWTKLRSNNFKEARRACVGLRNAKRYRRIMILMRSVKTPHKKQCINYDEEIEQPRIDLMSKRKAKIRERNKSVRRKKNNHEWKNRGSERSTTILSTAKNFVSMQRTRSEGKKTLGRV